MAAAYKLGSVRQRSTYIIVKNMNLLWYETKNSCVEKLLRADTFFFVYNKLLMFVTMIAHFIVNQIH